MTYESSTVQEDPSAQSVAVGQGGQTLADSSPLIDMPPLKLPSNLRFGPFPISTSQAFYLSPSQLSYGLVNIKPILPGHVLVCPVRNVPRLSQLTPNETSDLFLSVRCVSRTLQRVYKAESFNVAVQDGVEAGQSVPHVHVHIIPRQKHDMDARGGGDAVYDLMDGDEGNIGLALIEMQKWRKQRGEQSRREFGGPDAENKRVKRSEDEMETEAAWLRREMEVDSEDSHQNGLEESEQKGSNDSEMKQHGC